MRLIKSLLWLAGAGYLFLSGYGQLRRPSTDSTWFTPYASIIMAAALLSRAFVTAMTKPEPPLEEQPGEPLSRTEQIVFKGLGIPVVGAGLIFAGLGVYFAWEYWGRITEWPRTSAVLVREDRPSVLLRYRVDRQVYQSWSTYSGREIFARRAPEHYPVGAGRVVICYNPHQPEEVSVIPSSDWEFFIAPAGVIAFGLAFVAAGCMVWGWHKDSYRPI